MEGFKKDRKLDRISDKEAQELERKARKIISFLEILAMDDNLCKAFGLRMDYVRWRVERIRRGKYPREERYYQKLKKLFPSFSESITALMKLSKLKEKQKKKKN